MTLRCGRHILLVSGFGRDRGQTMHVTAINPFADSAPRFTTRDEARHHLAGVAATLSISNISYFGVSIPQIGVDRDYLITTYRDDWMHRYQEMAYQNIDPVVTQGLKSALPFDWKDRERGVEIIEDLFDDARSYGVSEQGLTVPVRGPYGERALIAVNTDFSARTWQDFRTEHAADLMAFAHTFHATIMDMEHAAKPAAPQLSRREIEVLGWAANGKSAWETGVILGLSERTIQFYCRNAAHKLNAANTTHAVSIAIRQDLLP